MSTDDTYESAIAIIGMSGRFPGAHDVGTLWDNLVEGTSGLRAYDDEELVAAGVSRADLADPGYVRIAGALEGIELFDAGAFGFNPREAALMDPQHRMFLECAWEALEVAGYPPTGMTDPVGVFAGCGFPDYIAQNLLHLMGEPGAPLMMAVGNERDSLASLVSYKLGLRGPAIGVQTFCSTSLVSVHLACQSLLTYECDAALAGGAFVPLPQPSGYRYAEGGILSPDGQVRSFDSSANGTVMGAGVGVVALKRMNDALADGDVIHSVVLGSAVNNDGRSRVGYTAPGVDGEAEVMEQAMGVADVKPASIGYVECHATGTSLGDSIELAALTRAFAGSREQPVVLGTLKPTLGHLDRASGVTGLIRATLNLEHRVLPGTPNYCQPNAALASARDQLVVLPQGRAWEQETGPRRAGVSSFGLGGTNAHVVLEEAPVPHQRDSRPGPHLLVLSGQDEAALGAATEELRDHLVAHPELDLSDVAFTLQVSRTGFGRRRAVVCHDLADAAAALGDEDRWIDGRTTRRNPRVLVTGTCLDPRLAPALATVLGDESETSPEAVATLLGAWLEAHGVHVVTEPGDGVVELAPLGVDVDAADWLTARLADLWIAGAVLDWPRLHRGEGRRVPLPTYPFQRRRHWVEPAAPTAPEVRAGKSFDRSSWTWLPTWVEKPASLTGFDAGLREAGPWLVLCADPFGEDLVARLRTCGAHVVAVRQGPELDLTGADRVVRPGAPGDLASVMSSLPVPPRVVLHGHSLASAADPHSLAHFDAEQARGIGSALDLAGALVDDTGVSPRVSLLLLTSGAVHVHGRDLSHPEHATLAALAPTLAQENPRLRCRHVDVDLREAHGPGDVDQVLAAALDVARAINSESPDGPDSPDSAAPGAEVDPLAVRGGESWARAYAPYAVEAPQAPPIVRGETVLITGGLGDVGLTMAHHLATRGCRLVLTARTPLPPREQWGRPEELPERAARHVATILALEARGAEVLVASADVADIDAMRAVVRQAVDRFGGIDVVVHAAGVQDPAYFRFAHQATPTDLEVQLAAKVGGFHVLQEALGDLAADRRFAVSSLAAVLGGITLGVYAAANAALDAYASVARRDGAGQWIAVDWDTWNVDPSRLSGHSDTITDFAMSAEEALDVFERCLAAGRDVGRLVISTGDLEPRLDQWVRDDLHSGPVADDEPVDLHPRPDLSTPYEPPAGDTEEQLAAIWSRVLGIGGIGVHDNFFELGGHSLLAMDLTHRIRSRFSSPVPVTGLLQRPTIREFAELLTDESTPTSPEAGDAA